MNTYAFTLNGAALQARPAGTLWWPDRRLLCVADLHLGKSERLARRGGPILPPYETLDTLARLADEVAATDPSHVIALGDSFDDTRAAEGLPDTAREALLMLAAGRRWTWITGNHDPDPVDLPGDQAEAWDGGALCFRHIARPDAAPGEVSGHFHPKARIGGTRRACFVVDAHRVVLPAFGTYTGGLDCLHPDLRGLFARDAFAILTGARCLPVPLGPATASRSPQRGLRRTRARGSVAP